VPPEKTKSILFFTEEKLKKHAYIPQETHNQGAYRDSKIGAQERLFRARLATIPIRE